MIMTILDATISDNSLFWLITGINAILLGLIWFLFQGYFGNLKENITEFKSEIKEHVNRIEIKVEKLEVKFDKFTEKIPVSPVTIMDNVVKHDKTVLTNFAKNIEEIIKDNLP